MKFIQLIMLLGLMIMSHPGHGLLVEPNYKAREQFNEILVHYVPGITELYNGLTPAERVMAYYLFRASLPAESIYSDQLHRYSSSLLNIFRSICQNEHDITYALSDEFIKQARTYLVYLIANNGPYFKREHPSHKRTPLSLGLSALTSENLVKALKVAGLKEAEKAVAFVWEFLSDYSLDTICTVNGNIDACGINIYDEGFTQEHYAQLAQKGGVNDYYVVMDGFPKVEQYKIGGRYSKELEVSAFWFKKALEHAYKYPEYFDIHFAKSLEHLLRYLASGNEDDFKEHSRSWLKTKSKITYTFGFIEAYDDPMERTGSMAGEVTITKIALDDLSRILPAIERAMPLASEYKRENTDVLPNASINVQLFGAGGYGPLKSTLAYCLPNYADIRSKEGSRQIIYEEWPTVGKMLNPCLMRTLFATKDTVDWLNRYDPDYSLSKDISNILTILHETIGHASGRLGRHTFKDGDVLKIKGLTYKVGDTISVTPSNIDELLLGYGNTLEELRAEIIAVWVAVNHLKDLVKVGFLQKWYQEIGESQLKKCILEEMVSHGLSRMLGQAETATSIEGSHAQANSILMHWVVDAGGAAIITDNVFVDDGVYERVALEITDVEVTLKAITELMQTVQHITSTGDGSEAKKLIETLGKPIRNINHLRILKKNLKSIVGPIKAQVELYPLLKPVFDEDGQIVDVSASWPANIFEADLIVYRLATALE